MSEPSELSESGQPVYRHGEPKKEFEFAIGDSENIEAISRHIELHLGTPATVFHEILSHLVHIDVHIVPPTEARPFYSLVTSGMSDKPMTVAEGYEEFRYAELMICLPPDWPMTDEDWKNEENYWPVELLKFMARMPHEYDTWLGEEHTVPNGDPPENFGTSEFNCVLISQPRTAPMEFHTLKVSEEKTIHFYGVFLLYEDETNLKLKKGSEVLWEKLEVVGVTELVDLQRKNTAKKRFGIF